MCGPVEFFPTLWAEVSFQHGFWNLQSHLLAAQKKPLQWVRNMHQLFTWLNLAFNIASHAHLQDFEGVPGCCLTGAWLPEAPKICSRATKILSKESAWTTKTYDSYGNSLYANFNLEMWLGLPPFYF